MTDANVEKVIALIRERSERALLEYGADTTRDDYSLADWLEEVMWESIDRAIYCAAAIRKLRRDD